MSKVLTAEQAVMLIKDGVTIGASAIGLAGWPEEIAKALKKRFLEKGSPKNLTLVHSSAIGDWKDRGTTTIGYEGLIKRWIGGHVGSSANMAKLVTENKVEAYNLPQGVIVQLWRETAAKRPGLITKVGLGTYVDPRLEGGKMNSVTTEDIVKVVDFEGEEWLFYKTLPVDVVIIRGTYADENGNLTMDKEGMLTEALPLAQAAKSSGGIVIAQVEQIVKANTLHPKKVKVPGILIDYLVVATDPVNHWQTEGVYFNPAFAGDVKIPLETIPELPLNERKIIARRAAMELVPGAVVNLGVGIPTDVAAIAAEEKISEKLILTTEAGGIGGVPASLPHFGHAYNAEAMIEHHSQFDFYDGGGIDVAFLGLAQTDKNGNVNVSKFSGRAMGCGGFINITQGSKKVVYCGTFTAEGLATMVEDGKLVILNEGKQRKFLDQVEQITFSGKYAQQIKQPVVYVTERAVFTLEDGGMTLIEIAPGIDLEKDVLGLMNFKPKISKQLKTMPTGIFKEKWGELKNILS
ncbi:MAG: acyl CoA:acetate/3-ketoacid CoA transferase [Peptococcales bacterium]|jgi:propionate CoA-transferase